MKRRMIAALLAALVSACSAGPAPLRGLWSSSAAACAAGLGVTFRDDAIRARFKSDTLVLVPQPRYEVHETESGALVSIRYALPPGPRDPTGALGLGVIDLQWSRDDARLAPTARRFVDLRTGAIRVPLKDDPVDRALALMRCPKRRPEGAS